MKAKKIVSTTEWRDLCTLSVKEMLIENNLSIPWVLASWALAYHELYWVALPFSAFFFLAALRQSHNAYHNGLGTNRFLTWLSLFNNSMLLMTSMHAVKFNHLRHHRHCLGAEDVEGKSAHMKWYQAILYGPVHIFKLHYYTWKLGSREYRLHMILELCAIFLLLSSALYFQIHWLLYHCAIMVLGEFLSAFFTVWTVHHDTQDQPELARTERSWFKNRLTYSMYYHLEHHLFPAVPTIKLKELAQRLDENFPELEKKKVF